MWRSATTFLSPPEARWVIADFHIHSTYSGGSLHPNEILSMAQNQFLDVVAISDHENIQGSKEANVLSMGNPGLPQAIMSQEISLGNHFHFLLIAGKQEKWGNPCRGAFLEKFGLHHQYGGIIILAHPWTMPNSGWAKGFLKEIIAEGLLDAVELFNSSILELPTENCISLRNFWEDWIAPSHVGIVGGSDYHYYRQGRSLGSGRTYLKVLYPGEKGILDALRKRRCVAGLFSYQNFDLDWLGRGHSILLGREPWLGELKQFIAELQLDLKRVRFLKPNLKKDFSRLIECGYYQMARELLIVN